MSYALRYEGDAGVAGEIPHPQDIVTVSGVGGKRIPLHRHAAAAWTALFHAARADGIPYPLLLPVSGYRSPQRQRLLWQRALQEYGSPPAACQWVAPPGASPHQSGRAIDFHLGAPNSGENVPRLRTLPSYRWLAANARRFGFYSYQREPWHWEYNPYNRPTPTAPVMGVASASRELANDLRWFLDGERQWRATGGDLMALAQELERLSAKMPCVTAYAESSKGAEVKQAHSQVRALMKRLGFYAGKLKKRPSDEYLRRLFPAARILPEPRGSRVDLFVYTSPGLSARQCKESRNVLCAYEAEAKVRAKRKSRAGVAIRLDLNRDSVDTMLTKLAATAQGKRVTGLQIFGHGHPAGQQCGRDFLKPSYFDDQGLPRELARFGARMAAGAEIRLYGCQLAAGFSQGDILARHLGSRLLLRGGKIVMFKDFVKLDTSAMRVIEPPASEQIVFRIDPCLDAGRKAVRDIAALMSRMRGKFKLEA